MSNQQAVTVVTITNPIDRTRSRTVIVTGPVMQGHIKQAIEYLDDNTPTAFLPESTDLYHVSMMPYTPGEHPTRLDYYLTS